MRIDIAGLACCLLLPFSSAHAESTESILARMDKAAPAFKGMAADLKMTTFTKILDNKDDEFGLLKMERLKPGDTRAIIDFSAAQDARIITFQGKTVRMFYPKLNEYKDIDLGKNSNVLNQFLLLGFGSSGRELSSSYSITNQSTEKIGGVETTKLQLIPNDPQVKERVTQVSIWVPDGLTYPIQQQFFQPSGNYQLVLYTSVELNPKAARIDLKLPRGATKQKK